MKFFAIAIFSLLFAVSCGSAEKKADPAPAETKPATEEVAPAPAPAEEAPAEEAPAEEATEEEAEQFFFLLFGPVQLEEFLTPEVERDFFIF